MKEKGRKEDGKRAYKEILRRLKKLEEHYNSPIFITVIYLVDGVEERKRMKMHEATELIMRQSDIAFFDGANYEARMAHKRIIDVEYEDSDGFLEALIDIKPIEPARMREIVDDGTDPEWEEKQLRREREKQRKRSIIAKLEKLEAQHGCIPVVIAEYEDGNIVEYRGLPPIEHLFDDKIKRTYGSEFADLVNTIIHPVSDRNFEDFEDVEPVEQTVDQEPAEDPNRPLTLGEEMQWLVRQQKRRI